MAPRSDLQELFLAIVNNVYFQPPPTKEMNYPCIVYHQDNATTLFADNSPYSHKKRYEVTIIDKDPDNMDIYDGVSALPMCTYNRFFATEGLNHHIFTIFF